MFWPCDVYRQTGCFSLMRVCCLDAEQVRKTSRRDLPVVVARQLDGATTVSATMLLAARAGIPIFVTGGALLHLQMALFSPPLRSWAERAQGKRRYAPRYRWSDYILHLVYSSSPLGFYWHQGLRYVLHLLRGIGGVHRGAERSMDISADLTELGRTPIAVVCAGVKSILDIPRTMEVRSTLQNRHFGCWALMTTAVLLYLVQRSCLRFNVSGLAAMRCQHCRIVASSSLTVKCWGMYIFRCWRRWGCAWRHTVRTSSQRFSAPQAAARRRRASTPPPRRRRWCAASSSWTSAAAPS